MEAMLVLMYMVVRAAFQDPAKKRPLARHRTFDKNARISSPCRIMEDRPDDVLDPCATHD
eukprot:8256055-Pyramimonas_sp.AAC.1